MTERIVVLIDMDCFYVQVESRDDPSLLGKPAAVVQYNEWRGGGIIAVNYEARAFGVSRNMRGEDAQEKCPEIILVKVPQSRDKADLSKYREAGMSVISCLKGFHPKFVVERASVDEAYIDITDAVNDLYADNTSVALGDISNTRVVGFENDVQSFLEKENSDDKRLAIGGMLAEKLRLSVYEKTGFRCSAGVAHNKILAKICCGLRKPNGQTILPHDSVPILYSDLKLNKLRGLGGKFGEQILEKLCIRTAAELSSIPLENLKKYFDEKTSMWLYRLGLGFDDEPVKERELPRSIGCSKNFRGPRNVLDTEEKVLRWLDLLSQELSERLIKDKETNSRIGKNLTVGVGMEKRGSVSRGGPLYSYEAEKISQQSLKFIKKLNESSNSISWSPAISLLSLNVSKFDSLGSGTTLSIKSFMSSSCLKENEDVQPDDVSAQDECEEERKESSPLPMTSESSNPITSLWSRHEEKVSQKEEIDVDELFPDINNVDPSILEILPSELRAKVEEKMQDSLVAKKEICPRCGIRVFPFEMLEHSDFHAAQDLQKELRKVQMPPVAKRKSEEKTSKISKKQKNILSFFNKE